MSDNPVSVMALQLEVARLEGELAALRAQPTATQGPPGPPGPMGPTGSAMIDPMAAQRHLETMTALNGIGSAVHRIAAALEARP